MAGLRALGLMRAAQDASTSDAESMPRVQTAPADQTDATAPADSSDADEEELRSLLLTHSAFLPAASLVPDSCEPDGNAEHVGIPGDASPVCDVPHPTHISQVDPYLVQTETSAANADGERTLESSYLHPNVLPEPRARLATLSILRLARDIQNSRSDVNVSDLILAHRWSAFNVPLMWAAAGEASHPVGEWLRHVLAVPHHDYESVGVPVTGDTFHTSWLRLRATFRALGIQDGNSLLQWLHSNCFQSEGVGAYFGTRTQEYVIDQL